MEAGAVHRNPELAAVVRGDERAVAGEAPAQEAALVDPQLYMPLGRVLVVVRARPVAFAQALQEQVERLALVVVPVRLLLRRVVFVAEDGWRHEYELLPARQRARVGH